MGFARRTSSLAAERVPVDDGRQRQCRRASRLAGFVGVLAGLILLLGGWAAGLASLRLIVSGYPTMAPSTALGVVLCGAALWFDREGQTVRFRIRVVGLLAGMECLLGLAILLEHMLGGDLGMDRLVFSGPLASVPPGRTASMTAAILLLLGIAQLISHHRRRFEFCQYLILTAAALCLFNALRALYVVRTFHDLAFGSGNTAMAIQTSLTFFVLCAGVLLGRPEWGMMSNIKNDSPGGVMARWLLPAALLMPVLTGWLRWRGQANGLYDEAFGLALFTSLNMLALGLLICRTAQILNDLDLERARAERGMRQLADSMPQIVFTATADGEVDYFNQRGYDYTGMNFEQIRDGGFVSLIHRDDVEDLMERWNHARATQSAYALEYRFKRAADGMYRWHLLQGIPIYTPKVELVRWMGTCTDIHSTKSAEDALCTSKSHFRQLADTMPQIVWTAGADGRVEYYNRGWREYTGMTLEQSKDWGWKPVLHPDDLQITIQEWTRAFTACGRYVVEHRFKRASDGAYRWHLGRAHPIRDASGSVLHWFGTCTDIEDQKKTEGEIRLLNATLEQRVGELNRTNQQLEKANQKLKHSAHRLELSNRELQDFASVASHDLQEPLRKVQAFGDRLKSGWGAVIDDQGKDYLDRMLKATKRMQTLIQDLLLFSRVTGKAPPFLPVDLAKVMGEVLSDLELRIVETGATVEMGQLPAIEADAAQMQQLFQNLIGNALKFHQAGKPPSIRIYAETLDDLPAADGMARIVVEDKGIGFDEKYLDRIFTMFQRLHGRAEYEGTGIGLAICRKIVQWHGGGITANSTVGEGTSFVVSLPVRQMKENSPAISPAAADMELRMPEADSATNSPLASVGEKRG